VKYDKIIAAGITLAACEQRSDAPAASNGSANASASAPSTSMPEPARLFRGIAGRLVTAPVVGSGDDLTFLSSALELKECTSRTESSKVTCRQLPGARRASESDLPWFDAALADAEPGVATAALVASDLGDQATLFRGENKVLVASTRTSIGIAKDGTRVLVDHEIAIAKDIFTISRAPADGAASDKPDAVRVTLAEGSNAFLALPWVIFGENATGNGRDGGSGGYKIRARRLLPSTDPIGGAIEVATVPSYFDVRAACRTDAGLAIAIGSNELRVLFERAGAWSVVEGGKARLVLDPDPVERQPRYDCDGDGIAVSWTARRRAEGGAAWTYDLHQIACTQSGCERYERPFVPAAVAPYVPHADNRLPEPVLGRFAGKKILFWQAMDGVRMRLGEIEQGDGALVFPKSADGAALFVRGASAWLFADAADELEVIGARIAASGAITLLERGARRAQ
jgi:hypothetical protein